MSTVGYVNPLFYKKYRKRYNDDVNRDDLENHCYMPLVFCKHMRAFYGKGGLGYFEGDLQELSDEEKCRLGSAASKNAFWMAMRYSKRMTIAWKLFTEVLGDYEVRPWHWDGLLFALHEAHHTDYEFWKNRLSNFSTENTTEINKAIRRAESLIQGLDDVEAQAQKASLLKPHWWTDKNDPREMLRELANNLEVFKKEHDMSHRLIEAAISNRESPRRILYRVRHIAAGLYFNGLDVQGDTKLHKAIAIAASVITDLVEPTLSSGCDDELTHYESKQAGKVIKKAIEAGKFPSSEVISVPVKTKIIDGKKVLFSDKKISFEIRSTFDKK